MTKNISAFRMLPLAFLALVLFGYGCFIVTTYRPYLNWHLRLRSPNLAGLPEDIIGFGFWMWWPFVAILFILGLALALAQAQRRLYVAVSFVSAFSVLSLADYFLCQRLIKEWSAHEDCCVPRLCSLAQCRVQCRRATPCSCSHKARACEMTEASVTREEWMLIHSVSLRAIHGFPNLPF
jgi:hypothetical protein